MLIRRRRFFQIFVLQHNRAVASSTFPSPPDTAADNQVTQIRHSPDEPLTSSGKPAYFSQAHNAWLEEVYSWKEGTIVTLYQNNAALTELARNAISRASSPYFARRRYHEPHNPLTRQPAYFSPQHNRWLEQLYGWRKGDTEKLYRRDEEMVLEAIGTISDAFNTQPTEWDPEDDEILPAYREETAPGPAGIGWAAQVLGRWIDEVFYG